MLTRPQDNSFALKVKTRLLLNGESISGLARKMGKSRNAVSLCIHHTIFPKLRARVKKELGLK